MAGGVAVRRTNRETARAAEFAGYRGSVFVGKTIYHDVDKCVNVCLANHGDAPCAIISDIHSNLLALEEVLADIEAQGIKRVCCLGDIVGYGPRPLECWRILSDLSHVIIRGNHDQALSSKGIARFHPRARSAILWTLSVLLAEEDGEKIVADIVNLPTQFSCQGKLYVHASPAGPTMDYLMPSDAFDHDRMEREFAKVKRCAFNGHTHIPGVIEKGKAFQPPEALDDMTYVIGRAPAIINVGSVGQPRDGNPKSCYVVIDGDRIVYRRVAYDVKSVCTEILSHEELDPFLGYRLLEGR